MLHTARNHLLSAEAKPFPSSATASNYGDSGTPANILDAEAIRYSTFCPRNMLDDDLIRLPLWGSQTGMLSIRES